MYSFKNIHLAGLYPCDYYYVDADTGLMARKQHKPTHINPMLMLLVNDLLHWYDGKIVVDHSMDVDDPGREFLLRVVLLFWCGDYPGLGEVTRFKHCGYDACHWCKDRGQHSKGLQRMVYGRYRRWLPDDDEWRHDFASFGSYEFDETPDVRTHEETVQVGIEADAIGRTGTQPDVCEGVKGPCFLSFLDLFNLIWDICPDLMHIIKNLFQRMFVPLFSGLGKRMPKFPRKMTEPDESHEDYNDLRAVYDAEMARFVHCLIYHVAVVCSFLQYIAVVCILL